MRHKARFISFLLALMLASPVQAQIVNTLPFQLQNGTTADATQVMADFNQIVNNTNANAAKNGANFDITSLNGLTTPLPASSGGSTSYIGGTSAGTNSIVVSTTVPSNFTLTAGKVVVFIAGGNNNGATQLNVAGTGLINLYASTPSGPLPLIGGEIVTGNVIQARYDGTQYQLLNNNLNVVGPLTSIASAATTDLGTVATHNINITGSTGPITSFGSSAQTAYPIYFMTFQSTPTLTYNAASMILPGGIDITAAAGDTAVAQYLGSGNWKVWSYQRISGTSVIANNPLCGASGLKITNDVVTPNTLIDITANQAVTQSTSGQSLNRSSVSTTVNTALGNGTSTAGGMDGEAPGTSQWLYVWLIDNGTAIAGLASTSSTSPTLPTGYTYKCRVGAMRVFSDGTLLRTLQYGTSAQYVVTTGSNTAAIPNIANGTAGTWSATAPVYAAVSITSFVPATATTIKVAADFKYNNGGAAQVYVAPNTSYSGYASTNPPLYSNSNAAVGIIGAGVTPMILEGSTIAWVSDNTGGAIGAGGWIDGGVNAN